MVPGEPSPPRPLATIGRVEMTLERPVCDPARPPAWAGAAGHRSAKNSPGSVVTSEEAQSERAVASAGARERAVLRGVEETATLEEPEDLRRATELWQKAYRDQMDGELLDRAMERSQRFHRVSPGETHTFMGWALSVQGPMGRGHRRVPPGDRDRSQFGNPSNDIGVDLTPG